MIEWLDSGVLQGGDVIVMDNCSIHHSEEIVPVLDTLLDAVGVRLYFLPTYSPEVPSTSCFVLVSARLIGLFWFS